MHTATAIDKLYNNSVNGTVDLADIQKFIDKTLNLL